MVLGHLIRVVYEYRLLIAAAAGVFYGVALAFFDKRKNI